VDADDDDVAAAYHELTGTRLDPARLRASRLRWALTDVAAFTAQLRGVSTAETPTPTRRSARCASILDGREPLQYGSSPR
jgi:hypothetical protein